MVINNFNVKGIAILETEAHAPLVVNAYAPLSGTVVCQCFQLV